VLRDPVEAEDAAQQTVLSAYRGLLGGQEPRDPPAWLGTIARNECRTRLRAQRTEPLTLVTAVSGDETQRDVGRRAEIEALCAALAELPQQQRDAIVLREFYGLSYAEVAGALGLSGAAVESLIFRSRKRLQEQLRPMRSALGVLTLPLTLRDSLAQVLPGFGGAGASAGAGAAVLAKVGSAPLAAKIAAATLAVGTAGVAGVETHHAERRAQAAPKRHVAAQVRELIPARAARTAPVVKVSLAAETTPKRSSGSDRSESSDERSGTSGGHEQSQLEPRDQSDHSGPSGHEEQTQVEPAATPEPEGGHGGDSGSGGGGDSGTGSGSGDSGSGDGHSGSGSGDSGS
jgi:RNA polymerase sigma-70 factor (ECF subfamily)